MHYNNSVTCPAEWREDDVPASCKVFRAKFMDGLQDAFEKRKLKFPGRIALQILKLRQGSEQ